VQIHHAQALGNCQSAFIRASRALHHDAEAVLAHAGEASASAAAFRASSKYDQDCIIEFLKSLQILPLSAKSPCVDENGKDIQFPPGITP
jgi:hypothetical protein